MPRWQTRLITLAGLALVLTVAGARSASAIRFYGSFTSDETIGATTYLEEDIFLYDNGTLSLFQSTASFFSTSGEDIDALYVDNNGDIYFSTTANATIVDGIVGQTSAVMNSGDIVRYSPSAEPGSQFSMYLDGPGTDVDGFWIQDGVPYVSVNISPATSTLTLGSNAVEVNERMVFTITGDLSYSTGTINVVLDGSLVLADPGEEVESTMDIDAFAMTDDGKYLFSSSGANSFLKEGGDPENFMDYIDRDGGVIFAYDPANPSSYDPREESSIYFDASVIFGTGVNLDALHFLPDGAPPENNADFNGDGIVNLADYTVWRDNLGGPGPEGDADGLDGVTAADYEVWKQQFGMEFPILQGLISSPTSVPEPATCISLVLAASALLVGQRRYRG